MIFKIGGGVDHVTHGTW